MRLPFRKNSAIFIERTVFLEGHVSTYFRQKRIGQPGVFAPARDALHRPYRRIYEHDYRLLQHPPLPRPDGSARSTTATRTYVLLSSLDETIVQHDQTFNLALHRFKGVYEPRGHKYITDFEYTPTPTITYRVGGVILRKEMLWIHKRTQLMIRYTLRRSAIRKRTCGCGLSSPFATNTR